MSGDVATVPVCIIDMACRKKKKKKTSGQVQSTDGSSQLTNQPFDGAENIQHCYCVSVSIAQILIGYITALSTGTQRNAVEISLINVDARCSYRVVATELHGAADDHDGDELPAHWAISEKFPGPAGPHASGFSLFL